MKRTGQSTRIRVIRADDRGLRIDLGEILRYRDLMRFYARKNIVVTYKQTVLGPLWLFLSPLAAGILQLFIFGYLARFQTGGVPRIVFYLFSNTAWAFYNQTLSNDAKIFTQNTRLFGKVYFPRLTISYANLISIWWTVGAQLLMSFAFLFVYMLRGEIRLAPTFPLIVFPLLQLSLLGQGVGLLYASVTVRYRDLTKLYPVITRALNFLSPVVYPLSQLGTSRLRTAYMMNPLCSPLELFRAFLWKAPMPPAWCIAVSAGMTLAINYAGLCVFSRVEKTFIDSI